MAVSANWSTNKLRDELKHETGVTANGLDYRFADGSRLKWISEESPCRFIPDDERFTRREQHRATAIEIAQQRAAGG